MSIKSVEEFETAINAEDVNKEELVQDLKDTLDDQKSKYTNKDKEVLKYKSAMKTLGYSSEEFESLDKFTEHMNSIKEKATTASSTGNANEELTNKLNLLETKLNAYEQKDKENKAKLDRTKIEGKLGGELNDKLQGAKYVIKDLINEKRVAVVDDEVVFKNGEDVVLFADGIKSVLEDNKELLKNPQNPGANTKDKNSNNTSNKNKAKYTLEQINKMSPEELKKNIKDIKASVKRGI